MLAFLINPENETITAVEYTGDYKNIYTHIEADCFDCVRINDRGDTIFVDDNGLYKNNAFFQLKGYLQPLSGRGLVLGTDEEGESVEPQITYEELQSQISFTEFAIAV